MKTITHNVAAFGKLVGLATQEGDFYQPTNPAIERTALQALLEEAQKSITAVHKAESDLERAINSRQRAFEDLPLLATRITAVAASCGMSNDHLEDLKRIRMKLRSQPFARDQNSPANGAPLGSPLPSAELIRRNRQLGFDNKLITFTAFVKRLENEPAYSSSDPQFSIDGLKALIAALQAHMNEVNACVAVLQQARQTCNSVVFDQQVGIYGIAWKVKQHFLGQFGTRSEKYVPFRRVKFSTR